MASSDKIHLLFFNACFSCDRQKSVVSHVDANIGMTVSIGDEVACSLRKMFYSSLGFGSSKKAFEQAKGVMMESPTEADTPNFYIQKTTLMQMHYISYVLLFELAGEI